MIITFPTTLTLNDWADQIVLDLDSLGVFGKLVDLEWQNWAAQFLNNQSLPSNLPNPYSFDDWKEWAIRFSEAFI
jgi:hypothetical protein